MKAFLGWICDHAKPMPPGLAAEHHPIAVLSRIEATSAAQARIGLGMAIGDTIEEFAFATPEQVAAIDAGLAEAGLPTLSEVRARFWGRVRGVLKRGRVRSDAEYYALRNAVEALPDGERDDAWRMLDAFERAK